MTQLFYVSSEKVMNIYLLFIASSAVVLFNPDRIDELII